MPRPKSLLKNLRVDSASRSHNCQHVSSHRIEKGQKRMKLTEGRSLEHFCIDCAIRFIESDIAKLQSLKAQLLETNGVEPLTF